jgi:hypothetical protein
MTDDTQQPADGTITTHSYMVPQWFVARYEQAATYLGDANSAFQRAYNSIGHTVFDIPDAVPGEDMIARWRSVILGHGLVALCSTLEALVKDTLTDWLTHIPSAWQSEAFGKLKIPFTVKEWTAKDSAARAHWAMQQLWKATSDTNTNLQARFEGLFLAVDIPKVEEPMSEALRDAFRPEEVPNRLIELWAMRNVIVHRLGVVDTKFLETCPDLGFAVGDRLDITFDVYSRYSMAVHLYLGQTLHRFATAYAKATGQIP